MMLGQAPEVAPSATSAPVKRKKPDDELPNGMSLSASKKQRTRVSFSCGECHRRKQKCDRQVPCSHCVARKVPDLCKAYTPGKADQDLSARISRLENIIEAALPNYWNGHPGSSSTPESSLMRDRRRSPSPGEDDNRSQGEDQDPSGGRIQSGKWYGNSASGSVAPGSVLEQLQHVMPLSQYNRERDHLPHNDLSGNGTGLIQAANGNKPESGEDDMEPSAADNLKSLVQECGVSPHKISELLQELPPQRLSDVLIDYYFTAINWTRYPVSERDFRTAYASISAHGKDGLGATNPHDVRFLPLLFVVLAIAVRLAPEHIAGDARTRRVTSLRYYWSSRRSLLIAAAVQPDSLDIVLTRLLSARFLTFDRRITECWSQLGAAVRTAQALGLHRDGSTLGLAPGPTEYRRRICFGRPNSIQDDYTSAKAPSNIEDGLDSLSFEPQPLSRPTPMTFVILRHQLAGIIGRMVHHFQQVKERSQFSEVIALDEELLKFMENLPPHFSLQPDRSLDETSPFIPIHRFLLITEILFVRISLHRPYLLRRVRSDRYARSRKACFESAVLDFQVRQEFREIVPKETRDSLSNAYREFQTAMISGIYFIVEPQGPCAETMHAILDCFMKEHEGMREMDETTRRELKTIEFLKNKAVEVAAQDDGLAPTHLFGKQEQQAQLLLGLQQSSSANKFHRTNLSNPIAEADFAQLNQSPTFQRLQHIEYVAGSPTTSNSPHADDESPAQSVLDHWVHTISNTHVDLSTGAVSWGGPANPEFTGWVGNIPTPGPGDNRLLGGLDGSDWGYWEALVGHVQGQRSGP
ncbi:hypothetical protein DFP72DRAFT_987584 [Ephemerocybe angulata]|uniref:Zn(2)-C6 fungal-type domain-containing protein n=1 Tax=Ephemerocybe angulata TaxID=980116 RepID=A0A8H6ID30_9AGAR|nr:hypothetical protein DFP72DRAFT_987584 [Tulosesus angulatus]